MPRRPASKPKGPLTASELFYMALTGVVVLVVGGLLFGPLVFSAVDQTRHPLQRENASYRHFFVLPGDGQDLFAVLSDDRIFTFDVRTGEEVARGRVACPGSDEPPSWYVPDGPLMWGRCGARSGLLVDLRTAQVRLDTEQLGGRHSELALGVRVAEDHVSHDVDAPTRALPVTLHDGRAAFIDAQGELLFARPPTPPWRPGYFCWPENRCSLVRKECLGFAPSADGHGMRLMIYKRHGERQEQGDQGFHQGSSLAGWRGWRSRGSCAASWRRCTRRS